MNKAQELEKKIDLRAGHERSFPTFLKVILWLLVIGVILGGMAHVAQLSKSKREQIPNRAYETLNQASK